MLPLRTLPADSLLSMIIALIDASLVNDLRATECKVSSDCLVEQSYCSERPQPNPESQMKHISN
ncbi:hypothetical protein PCASD_00457 [Puccinia coronata f. sp. avenae]|uniref:Uncharacterized protein n=1 Tax=Puccinia coronata f. sp. avenae TaxID=200324 RepID=A0A2N5VNM9_9BASI|nr:hypothetical protein PCASD_00457 [Puccinia coronata f. sp. avenae]